MTLRPLRVGIDVHTVGMRHTGNETYMRNLVEGLARADAPGVELVHYHTLAADRFPHAGWRGSVRRVRPHAPAVRIPFSFPLLLARDGIDVAHFQYVKPPLCPCPAVVTIHDISFESLPEVFAPAERLRMKMLVPHSARSAAHIITVSEFSKGEIAGRYRIAPERITVTPNGVSPAFRLLGEAPLAAARASLRLERPFILGVGNLQPRKNLERLVRAYARLRDAPALPHDLVLVGQQRWGGERVAEAVARAGVSGRVRSLGYVSEEDLVALYNLADAFAYPSLYEGFGLPVLEAMACGTPVITSHGSSLTEVAGAAAALVDPRDEEAIADALRRVLDDRGLHDSLRQRGLARAAQFSWDTTAQRTLAVYRSAYRSGASLPAGSPRNAP